MQDPILAFFGFGGGIASLVALAFWIWMLVDAANHEEPGSTKIVWVLIILLAPCIGALIYFFARKLPRG